MTARERVLAALYREKPDQLPWSPCVDHYFMESLPKEIQKQGFVALAKELGFDLMLRHVPAVSIHYSGNMEKNVFWIDAHHQKTVFKTPHGELSQIVNYHTGTSRYTEHFIKSIEDVPAMIYVQEHREYDTCYDNFKKVSDEIGDAGIALVTSPATPLAILHEDYIGLANTIFFLEDHPDEMKALMDAMHKAHLMEAALAALSPSPAVFSYDDTSTTTISRNFYNDHTLYALNDYGKKVKEFAPEKPYIVHMCGKLKGFKDLVNMTEVDGIDSLCPPSTGDVELWEGRNYWPDKVLIGGIDPCALAIEPIDCLDAKLKQLFEKIEGMDKLILCTGDAVAWGTPIENLKYVSKMLGRM